MTPHRSFAFVLTYVTDIPAARRFYVDVLGLPLQREHATFLQFEGFAVASDESLSGKNVPEVYWEVDDIDGCYAALQDHATVILPLTERPFGRVFAVQDPAGNPCYLVQFATHRPSQPVP
jgi:predicted enzyme related to lactoylglutathione lyase